MQSGKACWCAGLPPLTFPPEAGKGCYCEDCLMKRLADAALKNDFREEGA